MCFHDSKRTFSESRRYQCLLQPFFGMSERCIASQKMAANETLPALVHFRLVNSMQVYFYMKIQHQLPLLVRQCVKILTNWRNSFLILQRTREIRHEYTPWMPATIKDLVNPSTTNRLEKIQSTYALTNPNISLYAPWFKHRRRV